ncbi:hypothetical protein [Ancylobacter sp. IITR112]|uniref:hypothetical protein n=1 Tax=Ancylobacter sp. IITR112 TaxID=3138073 RepID=UPI00352A9023
MSAVDTAAQADSQVATPLLVPIQLDALVVEGEAGPEGDLLLARHTAERGASLRWKPGRVNYAPGLRTLVDPRLTPFLGAVPAAGDRLALRDSERPVKGDRGVYLRWMVPEGLRKSLVENGLSFPALPDQWLILRLLRRAGSRREVEIKAWMIDGAAYPGDAGSASLPVPAPGRGGAGAPELAAQPVGLVRTLETYDPARQAQMAHIELTALGTAWTGSPTFATSLAENRNILSWHDGLADLRDGQDKLPLASVSYAVVGWYRVPGADPLTALPSRLADEAGGPADLAAVLTHLGWALPPGVEAPGPCLFHGTVAHINFWDPQRYRGPLLGSPQSPPAHGGLMPPEPRIEVGLGASAPAALAALVSDRFWDDEVDPADRPKWAVLEGHLLGAADPAGLDAATRRRLDHPLGFTSLDAGQRHVLVQDKEAAGEAGAPTAGQWQELARLNERQSALNAEVRALIARANALRIAWRARIVAVRTGTLRPDATPDPLAGLTADLDAFVADIGRAGDSSAILSAALIAFGADLPPGWRLETEPEPPFWVAADPVVMLAGMPGASRAALPDRLPCRTPAGLVTQAPVAPERAGFPEAALAALAATLAEKDLARVGLPQVGPLAGLLREAALMEQAVASAAFAETAPFAGQIEWAGWKDALQARFRSGTPGGSLVLAGGDGREVAPETLVAVWGQQPWSPLYIDWSLGWHASPAGPGDWSFPAGQHPLHYDYRQPAGVPAAGRDTTLQVKGRSLMAPMDGGFMREALAAALAESRLNNGDFAALTHMPLVGQELSGLGAGVRRLNAQALTPRPDAALVWLTPATDRPLQTGLAALARLAAGLRIAVPPALPPLPAAGEMPPLEAGWFRLDHLWVIDDFGQWVEPIARPETRVQPHPRSRLRLGPAVDDTQCGPFARPPRLTEGARLDISFAGGETPIRGWLYLNRLDHALVLCDGAGRLLGQLMAEPPFPVGTGGAVWRAFARAEELSPDTIADPLLARLAAWLAHPLLGGDRLERLLAGIDDALPTIRAREAAPEEMLIGRPLAVVAAQARLRAFRGDPAPGAAALRLPLRLGNRQDGQDGLVAHAEGLRFSDLVALDTATPAQVGFAAPSDLVLIMDPLASVEVACGVLPAGRASLPPETVRAALARLEIGFAAGPVLFHGALPLLPPPASTGGRWEWQTADGAGTALAALGLEPRFDGAPPSMGEGWLILRRSEPAAEALPLAAEGRLA